MKKWRGLYRLCSAFLKQKRRKLGRFVRALTRRTTFHVSANQYHFTLRQARERSIFENIDNMFVFHDSPSLSLAAASLSVAGFSLPLNNFSIASRTLRRARNALTLTFDSDHPVISATSLTDASSPSISVNANRSSGDKAPSTRSARSAATRLRSAA